METTKHNGIDVLWAPLSRAEMEEMMGPDRTGRICANVAVGIDDIIEGDIESFDDIVSEKVTGTICLQDIGFKPIGVTEDNYAVIFEVTGFVEDTDLDYADGDWEEA